MCAFKLDYVQEGFQEDITPTAGLSAIFYELHLLALNPSPALHPHRFASDQFP
jgi:hypothetical protein